MICFYTTEASSLISGAATSVADGYNNNTMYAIEVASPVVLGASTLVVERYNSNTICATKVAAPGEVENKRSLCLFYATEVASPLFGAAVLTADEAHNVVTSHMNKFPSGAATSVADRYDSDILYATEVASPVVLGASTLVVERYNSNTICATEVATPGEVENKQKLHLFHATEVASPE